MKIKLWFVALLLFACNTGAEHDYSFIVNAQDNINHTPVYIELPLDGLSDNTVVCLETEEGLIAGQVERGSDSNARLWWIVNQTAGSSVRYSMSSRTDCGNTSLSWQQAGNTARQLLMDDQPVIEYVHPSYDYDNMLETKKPFHHVIDPLGEDPITKGPGGLYEHHRGIYFGYNHIYINGRDERIDIWHSNNGERSEHESTEREFSGPVMGGHVVNINWKDLDGRTFIEETREIRVFNQPEGESLIDFTSTLRTLDNPVSLGGDRQHAGVQFRAAQYVADNPEATRFIRPSYLEHVDSDYEIDGEDMMDLPWNAMYFEIEDKQFTVSYFSHPQNPGPAEMSERLYGRFGEFFPYELAANDSLQVKYRFWVKAGNEPAINEIDERYNLYSGDIPIELIQQ